LTRQTAQSGFIGVVWHPKRQLNTEFFCKLSLYSQCCLIVEWDFLTAKTEPAPQFVLWQFLHSDEKATLPTLTARPSGDQIVDRLPASEVKITNTEVSAFGNLKSLSKCR